MRIVIKTIFTIETKDLTRATEIIEKLSSDPGKTYGFQSFCQTLGDSLIGTSELQISGPSLDVHKIHEPEIDGPKPDVLGEPDAIDPKVTITDADGKVVK